MNPFQSFQRRQISVNSADIYEGLFSPENNLIVIIQNFYVWVVSSIGFLLLIPFYQPTTGAARGFGDDYTNYVDIDADNNTGAWFSPETLTNIPWILRNVADIVDDYIKGE